MSPSSPPPSMCVHTPVHGPDILNTGHRRCHSRTPPLPPASPHRTQKIRAQDTPEPQTTLLLLVASVLYFRNLRSHLEKDFHCFKSNLNPLVYWKERAEDELHGPKDLPLRPRAAGFSSLSVCCLMSRSVLGEQVVKVHASQMRVWIQCPS